eukprot:8017072-Heterocapsa_arctica.AAC.1
MPLGLRREGRDGAGEERILLAHQESPVQGGMALQEHAAHAVKEDHCGGCAGHVSLRDQGQ